MRFILWGMLVMCSAVSQASSISTQWLTEQVQHHLNESKLVGLGAVVSQGGSNITLAVAGERKIGSKNYLHADDTWHIGSITKSVTATLAAHLVAQGHLSWGTTLADVLPLEQAIDPEWSNVTLWQFLTHTAGAPANFSLLVHVKFPESVSDIREQRAIAVFNSLQKAPASQPGSSFAYSNVGYTIAGYMMEQVMDKPWETLVYEYVYQPLQLSDAGFGAPPTGLPRGHSQLFGFTKAAKATFDNTPIIGPAGTSHMSLHDIARYAQEHLNGLSGQGLLASAEQYNKLHTPLLANYAGGWVIDADSTLGLGPTIWHNGSNTRWYALLVLFPEADLAIAITANDGRIALAEKTAWQLVRDITEQINQPH